jgi:hypothetical protein
MSIFDGQQRTTFGTLKQVGTESLGMQIDFEMTLAATAWAIHIQSPFR